MVEDDTVVPDPRLRRGTRAEPDLDDTVESAIAPRPGSTLEPDVSDTVVVPLPGRAPVGLPDTSDTVLIPRAGGPDVADTVLRPRAAAPVGEQPRVSSGPPPYRFRVGHQPALPLDAPVLIGRSPRGPRIPVVPAPRLIAVPSPQQEVSSTHLELRQLGTTVVATDLRSTNGSTVRLPGNRPRMLTAGESVVVSPGTLIELGDGVTLEILPPHRPE